MRIFLVLLIGSACCLFPNLNLLAQAEREVVQMQPMIMVIPFAKEGENIRTVLEDDIVRRVVVTKVQEGFDTRGFTTVDFLAKLKAAELDGIITSNDQSDIKSQLAEYSGADIYTEVEAYYEESPDGKNAVRIILKGFDAFTGQALGSKTGSSPKFITADFSKLAEKALERREGNVQVDMIEEFLNVMQSNFIEINEIGRAIKVMFVLDQNAEYDFDAETADGSILEYKIEDWIDENAYLNNYSPAKTIGPRILFDQVRIPLREEGRNYTPNKFGRELRRAFSNVKLTEFPDAKLNLAVEVRGGTLYVTFK